MKGLIESSIAADSSHAFISFIAMATGFGSFGVSILILSIGSILRHYRLRYKPEAPVGGSSALLYTPGATGPETKETLQIRKLLDFYEVYGGRAADAEELSWEDVQAHLKEKRLEILAKRFVLDEYEALIMSNFEAG